MSQTEKIKITVSGVLELLKTGNDRKAIAAHYGISAADCRRLFQHPSLKGKKVIKTVEPAFELIDDTTEELATPETEEVEVVATETEVETSVEENVEVEAEENTAPTSAWE